MSNIFDTPLILALVAFVIGLIAAKTAAYLAKKIIARRQLVMDHRIRAAQAEIRVAHRRAEKAEAELAGKDEALAELRAEVEELRNSLFNKDNALHELQGSLVSECEKTADLREALSERAAETIHAEARAREMETALSVAQAGTHVVHDEVGRLTSETEELTKRLEQLQQQLADKESEESQEDRRSQGPLGDFAVDY